MLDGSRAVEPLESGYPAEDDVTANREGYIGDRVVLSGTVVETDPIVIATRTGGDGRFTVANAADTLQQSTASLETDDRVTAFGTLEDESTLDADRTVTDDLWGSLYMGIVSLIGGCWVLARLVRGWRVDRDRLALVPRTESLTGDGHRGTARSASPGGESVDGSSEEHRKRPDTGHHHDGGHR
ncbi:hypothetical protein [Natrinema amylolyticum]|uniref:hypothetical protein n=1 Tax=Natrinema amylolyticum TaxID=2878679 RepID=UPI001CFA1C28|nr:hypothetical protein [Natrinema amylolyticum]